MGEMNERVQTMKWLLDHYDERSLAEKEVLKTYEPLKHGQIRLLRLLPGKGDDVVCCQLTAVDIASEPVYEALSYAWGTSSDVAKLKLNMQVCWRRRNLVECLNSLRYEKEIRDLWVDALCINQANTVEKSSQINLMSDIYRSAARTLIWLGKDDDVDQARALSIDHPNVASLTIGTRTKYRCSEALKLLNHFAQDKHVLLNRHFLLMSRQLTQISRYEWWCRVWVVQETLLSRSAHLVLGKFMLPWHIANQAAINMERHLATCCSRLRAASEYDAYELAIREYLAESARVILSFELVPPGTSNTLLATLWMFRNRLASIKHDKIYGLLGLIPNSLSSMQPDYDISFEQACRLAVLQDIRTSGNLNALQGSRKRSSKFSSWSIDWSDLDYWAEERSRIRCNLFGQVYCASGSTQPRVNAGGGVKQIPENQLYAVGQVFDVIAHTEPRLMFSEDAHAESRRYPSLLESATKLCGRIKGDDYIGGGSVFNASWRTLVADCVISHHDSHDSLRSMQSLRQEENIESAIRRVESRDFYAFALWHANETRDVYRFRRKQGGSPPKFRDIPAVRDVKASVTRATSGRCMFLSDKGYLGLGPEFLREGDSIAILLGGSTPFVLRKSHRMSTGQQAWVLVGDCYVHGWMDGEMMRGQDTSKWGDIILV